MTKALTFFQLLTLPMLFAESALAAPADDFKLDRYNCYLYQQGVLSIIWH